MKSSFKAGKRVLSVVMAVLMVMTAWVFVAPQADAVVEKPATTLGELTFVVPEVIYCYPDVASQAVDRSYDFQYYVNNTSTGGVQSGFDTTGKIYYTYSGATSATLSYAFCGSNFNAPTNGTTGSSITLSSTTVNSGSYVNITGGTTPKINAADKGVYIMWKLSYTDKNDGNKEKIAYAFTYVYKPYTKPLAAGAEAGTGTSGGANWAGSVSWISGFHSITSAATKLSDYDSWDDTYNGSTKDNFAAFISRNNTIYANGTKMGVQQRNSNVGELSTSSGATNWYTPGETAVNGYSVQKGDNSNPSLYCSSGGSLYNIVVGKYRKNDKTLSACVKNNSIAEITVDTSRYSNLNQIPNLGVGFTVTDDQASDSKSGTWYIADATDVSFGDAYYKWHSSEDYYGNYTTIIAGQCSGGKWSRSYWESEGIRYVGAWPHALSGSTGTMGSKYTYAIHGYYSNKEKTAGSNYDASNNTVVYLRTTYYNKANLRAAVQNVTKRLPALGVKGISLGSFTSDYFDTTASYKWTALTAAYKKAVIALTTLDSTADMNALATELNSALNNLCTRVSFNANYGGTLNGTATQYVTVGTNQTIAITPSAQNVSVSAKDGYQFLGWSTSSTASTGSTSVTVGYNATVYAVYKVRARFFNATGNLLSEVFTPYGTAATAPASPTKATSDDGHYVFNGWDTSYSSVKEPLTINPTFTLKAHTYSNYVSDGNAECGKDGTKTAKCDLGCSRTKTVTDTGSALQHVFTTYTYNRDDTCTADGTESAYCDLGCGAKYTRTKAGTKHDHTFLSSSYVSNNDATCTEDGTKTAICAECKVAKNTIPDPNTALGHNWELVVDKSSSCSVPGEQHNRCSRCGAETEKTEIQTVPHTYINNWETTLEPTCTVKGSKHRFCTVCGGGEVVAEIPANGHDWQTAYTTDKEATCTENGSKSQHCNNCDATRNVTAILASGHLFEDVVTEPTCTTQGYTTHNCIREGCGFTATDSIKPALDHDFAGRYVSNNDAKCEEDGTKTAQCSRCDATSTVTDTGSKLGHKFLDADYVSNGDVTCTEDGTKTAKCIRCDATNTKIDPKLGHEFLDSAYVSDGNATCLADGTKTAKCSRCDATNIKTDKGSALGHDLSDWTVIIPAECEKEGLERKICSRCDYKEERSVNKLGHKQLPAVKEDEILPTCTTTGSYNMVVYCEACGKKLSTTPHTTEALGHTPAEAVQENIKDSDCETPGTYDSVVYCSVCTAKLSSTKMSIPAKGHKESEWILDKKETCTEKGAKHIECTVCTKVLNSAEIPATGHNMDSGVYVEATCTEKGYTLFSCQNEGCDLTEKKNFTPKVPHSPSAVEEIDESTRVPAKCDKNETYDMVIRCSVCNQVLSKHTVEVEGSAPGHTPSESFIEDRIEPNCVANGSYIEKITCTVCDAILYREKVILPATGHTSGDTVKEKVVPATCTVDGSHDEVIYCTVCDKELIRETKVDKAQGHVPAEPVAENVVTETCTADGSYDVVVYCSVCDGELSRTTMTVDKLDHTPGDWIIDEEATCYSEGAKHIECTKCNTVLETETIAKAEHSFDAGVVTKPTCSTKGYTTYTCQVKDCGYSYKANETETTEHSFKDTVTPPTCMTEGYTTHTCTICGTKTVDTKLPKEAHQFTDYVFTEEGTCVKPSVYTHYCKVCKTVESKDGELGTHVAKAVKAVPATCEGEGLSSGTVCSECGVVLKAQTATAPLGHKDGNKDHKCDRCGIVVDLECDCICHKANGLMKFYYSIMRVFWKLFGVSQTCYCGATHY